VELHDALRTTGAVRAFKDTPVDDVTLGAILDDARFAPSGGNRQAWRVIVIRDPATRVRLRDCYLDGWHDYVAHSLEGLVPFSPLASEEDRLRAQGARERAEALSQPTGFAETLDRVPALLAIAADLSTLAATDRDLGRHTIVAGASIYPFVWSILLAARDRGLGGVMTTMATRNEPEVQQLLGLPAHMALAAVVALGYPISAPTRLRRNQVGDFASIDRYDGPPLGSSSSSS
jgi:nitroreductase